MFPFRSFITGLLLALPGALFAGDPLQLSSAWVRALPPTQPNTAAYMAIENRSGQAIEIVSARSDVAGSVEFHETREVDGYMRMSRLPTLTVPAGQTLSLTPGGVHLMLLDLGAMPGPGTSVSLCLMTDAGQELCTEATARKSADDKAHQHHHH